MSRRVVVTGMGAITPIGLSVDEFWAGVKEGKIGFDKITRFDTADFKCKLAAEVKGFEGKNYMDFKAAKRMELLSQYAVAATKEALEDAGLDMAKEDPYRVGVAVGSGTGSLQAMERSHTRLVEKGPGRIEPLFVPLTISNMAAGNVSIQFGLKGKSINVVTACATGTNSIGEAFRAIQYGDAEVMVAGGTEGSICPIGVGGFSALTALSTSEDPERCSIPFDKERGGFVMGEGSAVLVLEELEHALARGAKIYAEVAGGKAQGGTPLSSAGFGGEVFDALAMVVVCLRDGGVGFMGACHAGALVLEVDAGGGVESFFQCPGTNEGGRPPYFVEVLYFFGDIDESFAGEFLIDEFFGENGKEVFLGCRFPCGGVQGWKGLDGHVRCDVVPCRGHFFFIQGDFLVGFHDVLFYVLVG